MCEKKVRLLDLYENWSMKYIYSQCHSFCVVDLITIIPTIRSTIIYFREIRLLELHNNWSMKYIISSCHLLTCFPQEDQATKLTSGQPWFLLLHHNHPGPTLETRHPIATMHKPTNKQIHEYDMKRVIKWQWLKSVVFFSLLYSW